VKWTAMGCIKKGKLLFGKEKYRRKAFALFQ
jgi:hypothetical protein